MARITQHYVEAFALDDLHEHPSNPRRHDDALLDDSLNAHGFYGAVLVQRSTSRLIAGHGRARAARRAGESTVPALVLDVDDDTASRLLLIDNATSDSAHNDAADLAALLDEILQRSTQLDGTGYSADDLAALLDRIEPSPLDDDDVRPLDRTATHTCPACGAVFAITAAGPSIVSA